MSMDPLIPRAQLAKLLGVSVRTLQIMHRRGVLVGYAITPGGRKISYRKADVDAYLEKCKGAA